MVDFEGKKDAVQVFNNLLRRQIGTRTPTVEYICTKVNFIIILGSSDLIIRVPIILPTKCLSLISIFTARDSIYFVSWI